MIRKILPVLLVAFALLLIQCQREPLTSHPKVQHLSDYQSQDGSISLQVTGGKPPYSYQWSNYATDSVLSQLCAGDYRVTITDSRGKEFTDTISVSQPPWPVCKDIQGNSYKTKIIGNQIWMVENLRTEINAAGDSIASLTYMHRDSNAAVYGRLYTWQVAMNGEMEEQAQGLCPDGWHIPSDAEWRVLIENISNVDQQIPDLKKSLELQYAGFYNKQFHNQDVSVSYWTSTKALNNAWKRYFNVNLSKAFRYHENCDNAISVRCIKDENS